MALFQKIELKNEKGVPFASVEMKLILFSLVLGYFFFSLNILYNASRKNDKNNPEISRYPVPIILPELSCRPLLLLYSIIISSLLLMVCNIRTTVPLSAPDF